MPGSTCDGNAGEDPPAAGGGSAGLEMPLTMAVYWSAIPEPRTNSAVSASAWSFLSFVPGMMGMKASTA